MYTRDATAALVRAQGVKRLEALIDSSVITQALLGVLVIESHHSKHECSAVRYLSEQCFFGEIKKKN